MKHSNRFSKTLNDQQRTQALDLFHSEFKITLTHQQTTAMVIRLRKTLSDRVVKKITYIMDRSRSSSTESTDNDEFFGHDDVRRGCRLRSKTPSFLKRQTSRTERSLTVTGCAGNQVVTTDQASSWFHNDHTETTIDRDGVKTTSFCASEL